MKGNKHMKTIMKIIYAAFAVVTLLTGAMTANAALGNYPAKSLPLSTDTTVTPGAAPTNTTRITVSTSTNFKGKLEGYPATGVVRVTDAHPAGAYTVTVTAFDSGGATATKTFTLTVTTPATCTPVTFAAAANFATVGLQPYAVAVGDFNGDGKQDLAVPTFFNFSVSILLGDGAGNFSGATDYHTGSYPTSVAVGDFNGDGKQDLAVTNAYDNAVAILLGNGDGSFQSPVSFYVGSYPLSVAVADFNGDGKRDLAVANGSSNDVSILLGNGDGSFQSAVNFGAGSAVQSVAVGDFNADGKQDLAIPNAGSSPDYNDGTVSILLGNGDGTFSGPTTLALGSFSFSVAVGDFNGDGKQDLAVSNNRSANVSILLGDGAGNFSAPTNVGTDPGPLSVAAGDFNGDGKQDLAVSNGGIVSYAIDKVSIFLGNGDGGFQPAVNFDVGSFPISAAVGDFNGDGKQDLAIANRDSYDVSILLRDCITTYAARIQQPINSDGTSIFTERRGVVPVKFTLTLNGVSTCTLPPATIAVTRTAGGTTGAINESVYSMSADSGSNFRIDGCEYAYNLNSGALGVGTYRVDIKINNEVVGSATFQLK
jgi:VCBS repeat protein/FG-GAP repeat protein